MYSEKRWDKVINENEKYFQEKYSNLEKEFISELYKDIDSLNKEEFQDSIEEVEKQYYEILYPKCWNFRTLRAVEELYEV